LPADMFSIHESMFSVHESYPNVSWVKIQYPIR